MSGSLCSADRLARMRANRDSLHLLVPEASPRRYFRSADAADAGWLLVESPTPAPRAATTLLTDHGVRVPFLGAEEEGCYLVEDLGDRLLASSPTEAGWEEATRLAVAIATIEPPAEHPSQNSALDSALFLRELAMFRQRWVTDWRQLDSTEEGLVATTERLAAAAGSIPFSACQHRDFHSHNLLLLEDGSLAVIDHQDLRPGPYCYDLASLLTDAYAETPDSLPRRLREAAEQLAPRFGSDADCAGIDLATVALQRVLKALGTFGDLLAEGREQYAEPEARARRHAVGLLLAHPDPQWRALLDWVG